MNIPFRFQADVECRGTIEAESGLPVLTDADVRDRLRAPVWPSGDGPSVFELVHPGESVCLVVSDQTRKTGVDRVLPTLIDGLTGQGCSDEDISFLFATGIHRPPTPTEQAHILGRSVFSRFRHRLYCHDPDADDLVAVGVTRRGHPVRVNRRAVETDRLVLIGSAGFHYHAGFGGGRKSLVPGLAARETIAFNHSLTLDPHADRVRSGVEPGRLDGNPVAEEMLEAARLHPPDIIVNTVLAPSGELVGLFSGDLDAAHRAACAVVRDVCGFELETQADIVLASAGSAANWIQSHKALFNASRAVHARGRVILAAPCPEGLGNDRFRFWLRKETVGEIYSGLREQPEVNGQTALSTRERGSRAVLVTSLSAEDRRELRLATAPDVEAAFELVIRELHEQGIQRPTCLLMPQAMYTVPFTGRRRNGS